MGEIYFSCLDSSDNYGCTLDLARRKLQEHVKIKKMVGADIFTQVSRSLAFNNKHYIMGDKHKLGLIYVTEYGNLNSMIDMSSKARNGEFVSTKLFPNAIVSTASNATALLLETRGINLTINGGFLGYCSAVELATMYIDSGELDTCIVMSGDDYNDFSALDIKKRFNGTEEFFSNVTIAMLSKFKGICSDKEYIIEDISLTFGKEQLSDTRYLNNLLWNTSSREINEEIKKLYIGNKYFSSSYSYYIFNEIMKNKLDEAVISFGLEEEKEYTIKLKKSKY